MKMPVHCPYCKGPMINKYDYLPDGSNALIKTCDKNITHNIVIRSTLRDHDLVNQIILPWSHDSHFKWGLLADQEHKFIFFYKGGQTKLPFFEPDLSDYPKLVNKLKTYLIFL